MNHIWIEHGRSMSTEMQKRMKCVFNRFADKSEDWDLNIPLALEAANTFELPANEENMVAPPVPPK